jgi:hypothetical protein
MTGEKALLSVLSREILNAMISLTRLQFALLEQQYAPNDPIIAKIPQINISGAEDDDDVQSDKVTVGDATSVLSC